MYFRNISRVYFVGWVRTLGTSGQPHDSFLEHWTGKCEQHVKSVLSALLRKTQNQSCFKLVSQTRTLVKTENMTTP